MIVIANVGNFCNCKTMSYLFLCVFEAVIFVFARKIGSVFLF